MVEYFTTTTSSTTTTPTTTAMAVGEDSLFGNTSLSNMTGPCRDENMFFFYKAVQRSLLWTLFALIVGGNSIVILAVCMSKASRRSRMNFFILHLATADLLVGVVSVLVDAIRKTTLSWLAGNVMCKLVMYLVDVVTYASTFVLVALSIDRFDAIARPLNFSGKGIRAKVLVGLAWSLAGLFAVPMLIFAEEQHMPGHGYECWVALPEPWHWKPYLTSVAISVFFLPTLIISACYTAIIYIIWSKSKIIAPVKKSVSSKKKTRREEAFVVCWSPFFIYNLLDVYGRIPCSQHIIAISTLIQSLAPLNSAANPVIYGIFSTRICRYLRKIPVINWIASKICCCCIEDTHLRRFPSNAATHTEFTSTCVSDLETGYTTTRLSTRRNSGLPLVHVHFNQRDNQMLLRTLKPHAQNSGQ